MTNSCNFFILFYLLELVFLLPEYFFYCKNKKFKYQKFMKHFFSYPIDSKLLQNISRKYIIRLKSH